MLTRLFIGESLKPEWEDNPFAMACRQTGEVYREKEGRRTLRFEHHGEGYFLKLHQGVGWKEIFKNLFQLRLPVIGATNEWRAVKRLPQLGIDTLDAVGYGCQGFNPARQLSFLVTRELLDVTSLEDYCRDWGQQRPAFINKHRLLKRVADISRLMHEDGINHRDYYLCHFLMDNQTAADPVPRLHLMDLHRAQFRNEVPHRWRVKDLAGLWYSAMDMGLTRRDCYRFIRYYSGHAFSEEWRNNSALWLEVNRKAEALYLKDFGRSAPPLFRPREQA